MSTDPSLLRLGFAGTPEFAVPALDALTKAYPVCGVFTQPDRPAGRGQPVHSSPIKNRANDLKIAVHQPQSLRSAEALDLLRNLHLDALVVVAYGLILPPAALESARLGCFNIHASLLPRWRGAAPIQRALLAGDTTTGITIMRMEAGLDTGPMLARRELTIGARDTAKSLHDRLAEIGAELIVETLDALFEGRALEVSQPSAGVTYAEKIRKAEALIDWQWDAERIVRQVRAFNPWPIAETRLDGAQLRVWDAEARSVAGGEAVGEAREICEAVIPGTVLAAADEGIDVACGRGVVRILRLQLAGRKALAAREFNTGLKLRGARFVAA